jgi:DNA repair ATPase RecN
MEKDILHQLSVIHANYKANIEDVISVLQEKKIELDEVERKIEEMKELAHSKSRNGVVDKPLIRISSDWKP